MLCLGKRQVGGALCLLHEVREVEVVLQAGQALLGQQQDLPKMLHRDVVLAMALSYVELSREAMAESPPAVVKSCSLLESALKLLQVCCCLLSPTVPIYHCLRDVFSITTQRAQI